MGGALSAIERKARPVHGRTDQPVLGRPFARPGEYLTSSERRLWVVASDFRTSGSTSRVDRTSAPDVPFCAASRPPRIPSFWRGVLCSSRALSQRVGTTSKRWRPRMR